MAEKETTAVDQNAEKEPTTAVESEESLEPLDLEPIPIPLGACPMMLITDIVDKECLVADCAWWLEGKGRDRKAGCSLHVMAEALSELIIKIRKGKVFGR